MSRAGGGAGRRRQILSGPLVFADPSPAARVFRRHFRSCRPSAPSFAPASTRHPLPPPLPARTWPERRSPRRGEPLSAGPAHVRLRLPAAAGPLAALPQAPWRNPGQTREQPATFPRESLAWRLWGKTSGGGASSAGPKLPGKRPGQSIRVSAQAERAKSSSRGVRAASFASAQVCLYRIWEPRGTAHPLPRPALPACPAPARGRHRTVPAEGWAPRAWSAAGGGAASFLPARPPRRPRSLQPQLRLGFALRPLPARRGHRLKAVPFQVLLAFLSIRSVAGK